MKQYQCIRHFPKKYSKKKTGNPHLILNDKQQQYYALAEIHTLLKSIGKSLKDYTQMPQPPNSYLDCSVNNLIIEETSYNIQEMEKEHATLISSCNTEQLEIYNAEVFYNLPII
ncbi:hypothetical protein POM88_015931 [Heracleum sosnowskyi]|uniref:Uncharacterized protein n=1 Tax=Heracleum sosnowskyi TaxID=360622 RepID=A0AAD8MXZ9_9APIA|nr:hypothetical protein POM88_015931 [Heracleum sosnowskyi]